ncbi:hypothetical protein E2C01_058010 [Portunus trituberculatus]|uniref:Uncharacterized protein n=1 Tax=Portunus trituberculatus TaxID=210409 RepID=A0A5B7GYH8_PORTR|nr:hypothetical protein [Portunus trituberculatus]
MYSADSVLTRQVLRWQGLRVVAKHSGSECLVLLHCRRCMYLMERFIADGLKNTHQSHDGKDVMKLL